MEEEEHEGGHSSPPIVDRMQDWEENLQYQENILHAHRTAPEVEGRWTDRFMKLMVVGESGQGKTTFIHNMFMAYTGGAEMAMADGSSTSMADFVSDPAGLCTTFQVDNDEEQVHYHFTVQDTPGYGDDLNVSNSINTVVNYVVSCNERFYSMEMEHGRRHADAHECRVDVCLYFVAAHRLKPIDLRFIAALSPHVAIIPIIAKADSMTAEELDRYREEVQRRLGDPEEAIQIFSFSDKSKEAAGVQHAVPPFAVVSSTETDPTVGPFWPVRRYNWGTCEAFRSRDSDFACLKRLVLELSYWDIRDATEKRYSVYRKAQREAEQQRAEEQAQVQAGGAGMAEILGNLAGRVKEAVLEASAFLASVSAPPEKTSTAKAAGATARSSRPPLPLLLLASSILVAVWFLPVLRWGPTSDRVEHLLAEIREREAHITQLQAEAMGLLQSLSADSSHSACLYTSPGAPHAARQLEETVLHYMYGGMCYDEDYDPGMPWLLRLLISGCLLHTVWAVCCNPHLEEALPPWVPVYFVRAAACLLGLSCQLHLWKAFASRGA